MTCTILASTAAAANEPYGDVGGFTVDWIVPSTEPALRAATGFAKLAWFRMFYAFAPIMNPERTWNWMFFLRHRSVLKMPGPRKVLRGTVPKVVAVPAGTNWLAVKHGLFAFTALEPHCLGTAVVGVARMVTFCMLLPLKLSIEVPSMMLKGKPV